MQKSEIIAAVDDAIDKFYESVQSSFPEIKSGILFKNTQSYHRFHIQCQHIVSEWCEGKGVCHDTN